MSELDRIAHALERVVWHMDADREERIARDAEMKGRWDRPPAPPRRADAGPVVALLGLALFLAVVALAARRRDEGAAE